MPKCRRISILRTRIEDGATATHIAWGSLHEEGPPHDNTTFVKIVKIEEASTFNLKFFPQMYKCVTYRAICVVYKHMN